MCECREERRDVLRDDARGAHALGPLRHKELAGGLDGRVDVVALIGAVGDVVVGDVVDLVLLEELGRHDPRAVFNHLVHPSAVADRLGAFLA